MQKEDNSIVISYHLALCHYLSCIYTCHVTLHLLSLPIGVCVCRGVGEHVAELV